MQNSKDIDSELAGDKAREGSVDERVINVAGRARAIQKLRARFEKKPERQ